MRTAVSLKQIDATLERCRLADRAEYFLAFRDLMNRGRHAEARELVDVHFKRGTITTREALDGANEVKAAQEAREQELRN